MSMLPNHEGAFRPGQPNGARGRAAGEEGGGAPMQPDGARTTFSSTPPCLTHNFAPLQVGCSAGMSCILAP